MRRLLTLLAVAALGVAGCGDDDGAATTSATGSTPAAEVAAADLAGRQYVSTATSGRDLVAGSRVTLRFDDDTLAVNAGCNTLLGGYEVADGRLRWATDPTSTMIGCRHDLQQQDEWLIGFLRGDGAAATSDGAGGLVLRRDGVELTLGEERREHPALPIVGTYWTLETIADAGPDGSAASVPAGVRAPTLRFTADDRVVLFAGCNTGGGRAVVRDDGFAEIGPLTLTRMACGKAATATERAVTAILDGRVALASGSGGRLIVSKAGRQLVFAAR